MVIMIIFSATFFTFGFVNSLFCNFKTLPWGQLSVARMEAPQSDVGPILCIRPGEQLISIAEIEGPPAKRTRYVAL